MKSNQPKLARGWKPAQAYLVAVLCAALGCALGYLSRGEAKPDSVRPAVSDVRPVTSTEGMRGPIETAADVQAQPFLHRLQAKPDDVATLTQLGDLYYDAHQFASAIRYYDRALQLQPGNTDARTDMGTAYWYLGDTGRAYEELEKVLQIDPNKSNALFNLGMVQWRGKQDPAAAVSTWKKLLATNPNYENKAAVEQLLTAAGTEVANTAGASRHSPSM